MKHQAFGQDAIMFTKDSRWVADVVCVDSYNLRGPELGRV
jgi:spermidine synthase